MLTAATAELHPGFFASLAANSHPGHQPSSTNPHPASVLAISNTATKLANHQYDSCGKPRNTAHLRDAETGLDFMQARYYSSASGRFTSPDKPLVDQKASDPQSWNLYTYVRNNPLKYTDPSGHCSAPAVGKGQVGVCVDLYIAAPRIDGIGHGDNRGPKPNDPGATYRTEVQLALDPKAGTVSVVKNDPGVSRAVLIEIPESPFEIDISRKGASVTDVSDVRTDRNGNMHFSLSNTGLNGLSELPMAPTETIKTDLYFVFTPDGRVGLDPGGRRTAYPSIEVYRYDTRGNATPILHVPEKKPEDLCCQNQEIPAVPPR